ncbi:reverse transcriptase, partial [Pelobates cultripes]
KPFVERMTTELREYFLTNTTGEVSDYTVWSAHKAVMRGQFIKQSAYIKRRHQTTLLDCHKQIAIATAQNKKTPTPALADKLRDLYQDLNNLNAQKNKYFLHRLKATTYHHSGKASKYLANRLRTKQAANRIPYIIGHTGDKLMNPMDIVQEFAHFYKQLYNLDSSGGATAPDTQAICNYL